MTGYVFVCYLPCRRTFSLYRAHRFQCNTLSLAVPYRRVERYHLELHVNNSVVMNGKYLDPTAAVNLPSQLAIYSDFLRCIFLTAWKPCANDTSYCISVPLGEQSSEHGNIVVGL